MKVYVNYNDARWRKYKIDFKKIACMAAGPVYSASEVSITLVSDDDIHELNRVYRGIDKPTNVLSFELGDDMLMGDIFISLDTVKREAAATNISVAEHTAHMVVHGMLHLQGYDHIADDEAAVMESKEIKILKKLGIKNPYEESDVCACDCGTADCCPGARIINFCKKLTIRRGGVMQYFFMMLCGAFAAMGFAPFHLWWATLIGIGFAYWLITRDAGHGIWRTFLRVLPFSAVYSVAMFWWMLHSIYVLPELTAQFAVWTVPALIGIALAGGVIFSIPFVAVSVIRVAPSARPFVFAGVWTLILWLREWMFTGFPWNPVSNIAMPWGALANSMALWGALGLTFIIIGIISSAVEFVRNRQNRMSWGVLAVFILFGGCGALYGYHNMRVASLDSDMSPVMRIVQPAGSATNKAVATRADALAVAEYNVRNLFDLASVDGDADVVIFPETSYPFVIVNGDDMPMAKMLDKDLILGATSYNDGRLYNSMVVANRDGGVETIYSKSHLVPFGEYGPFGTIVPSPGNLTAGGGAQIISMNINGRDFRFAPAICYEVIFSDALLPRGAVAIDAIINITNDNWFGNTPGTYQHLDMVRRYAIESGLPIVRANYSGISAFISASGQIVSFLPVGMSGVLDGVVSGAHITPYRAIGRDGVMIIILICSVACVIISSYRKDDK
ncbi:MAG: apolipoprotein N-acyltransferase [Muribaculaceae bacterium]|nr:apolipoprotein N-acyltransferase [Muribaculaceae bacterium]